MAVLSFTDGYVSINGTNLSAYCKGITLDVEVEDLDSTAMGTSGYKSRIGGLKDGSLSLSFNQDFAASALDSVVWPLFGTVVTFEVRPTSSAVGTSNPKYTGSVLIKEWNPFGNSVGELAEVEVSWPTSGTVSRATA